MTAVSPTPADVRLAQRPVRSSVRALRAVGRWGRQVAGRLPGDYTIGKLDTFHQFRQQATPSRVLSILLLTPTPCLLVNLLMECIPLADPATGFQGSFHFQMRHFIAGVLVAAMPLSVKLDCIPDLPVRSWTIALAYAFTHAVVAIGSNAVVAVCTGVFPVPFAQFAPTVPLAIVGGTLNHFFLQTPATKERVEKLDQWAAMDVVPIFVYPIFMAVFITLQPTRQLWLSLLLPVIKRFIRQMVWRILQRDLDLVGATACTVSHLYHVLFTVMCLQNAKSLETLTAIVLVNVLQMLLNCRDVLNDAARLQRSRTELANAAIVLAEDAVSAALQLADGPLLKRLHNKSPSRVISTYPGYQRVEFMARSHGLLKTDETSAPTAAAAPRTGFFRTNPRRQSNHRSLLSAESLTKQTTPPISLGATQTFPLPTRGIGQFVVPTAQAAARSQTLPAIPPTRDHSRLRESFIGSLTSALQQTETILLRSYITIFVLGLYGIYLVVVFWLPNRKYFATMASATTLSSMISHLLLLGGMEVLFLVMYLVLIQRRLGVSGAQQLAFVLSTQRVLIQAKFLTLTLMILGFPLQHYGNGIIFKLRTG